MPDAIIKCRLVISRERERCFVRKLILAVLGIQLEWNISPSSDGKGATDIIAWGMCPAFSCKSVVKSILSNSAKQAELDLLRGNLDRCEHAFLSHYYL